MSEVEQALTSVLDVFVNYPKRIALLEKQLKVVEREIVDLLHVVEMVNFNAQKGYVYAKELQKARLERRKIKDELALLMVTQEIANPTEKELNKAIWEVRGVLKHQSDRTYKMRERKDLQELIK